MKFGIFFAIGSKRKFETYNEQKKNQAVFIFFNNKIIQSATFCSFVAFRFSPGVNERCFCAMGLVAPGKDKRLCFVPQLATRPSSTVPAKGKL